MPDRTRKPKIPPNASLAVVWRPIEVLRSVPKNPRVHSTKQIRELAKSIVAFGFNVPILVDRRLQIIAGHGRLMAARELGWREVPTILLDHLSEAEACAFTIADNRVAETAAWNNTLLTEQLKQISRATPDIAIETTGFELTEIGLLTAKGAGGVRKPSRRPTPQPASPPRPACRDVPSPRSPK
jgi:ParB-like chromosome segregation protein Spo0J